MATWNGRTRGSGFDLLKNTLGIVMNMFARRTGAEMDAAEDEQRIEEHAGKSCRL